jgi:hypothetical protein
MALLNANFLAPSKGFYEPQRAFNWALEIALDDAGDQQLIVTGLQSFEGVSESNEEIELQYANERRYVAGQASYEAAPLVLNDFVDIGVAAAIIRWSRQVYNPETGSIGLARDYKKNADLTLVSPDQSIVRVWKFIGMWPQMRKYGAVDMTSNDKVQIEVTLRFDKAIPSTGLNSGLGSINVGNLTLPL